MATSTMCSGIPDRWLTPRTYLCFNDETASEFGPDEQAILASGALPNVKASQIVGEELSAAIERYLAAVDRALQTAAVSEPRRKQLTEYIEQLKPRRESAHNQGFDALVKALDSEIQRTSDAIDELLGKVMPARPQELAPQQAFIQAPQGQVVYSAPMGRVTRPQYVNPDQIVIAPIQPIVGPEVAEHRMAMARRREGDLEQQRIEFEIWARDCKDRAEALRANALNIEPQELRILAEQIAFEGRIQQFAHREDLMRSDWSYLASICEKIFGTLTSIAKYHLNNIGIKIRGIRRDVHADWEAMLNRVNQELIEYRQQQEQGRDGDWQERQRAKDEAEMQRIAEARREAAIQGLRPRLERETFDIVRALERGDEPNRLDLFTEDVKNYLENVGIDEWILKLLHKDPIRSLFSIGGDFRYLRKKLDRFQAGETAEEANAADDSDIAPTEADGDAEWAAIDEQLAANKAEPEAGESAFEGLFSGCRGIMAGGKRKAVVETNVKKFFKFDEFEWVETTRGAAVDRKLVTRVENGKTDIVFVLGQFLNKGTADALREACKTAGIPCVHLDHGYNKGAICRGIEEYEEARLEPPILDRG